MPYTALEEEWACLRSMLPNDLNDLAREHGAMQRARGEIHDAETLLRLLLLHIGSGLSLEQTGVRAAEQGLPKVSGAALFKRLRGSEQWLGALTQRVLQSLPGPRLTSLGQGYRLRILDATCIQEPGSTGTNWRLHYSLKLPELVCDFFALTDLHGAELLTRLPVTKGDVILADRGYSRRAGAAAILGAGADLVMRLWPSQMPLLRPRGQPFDLLAWLQRILPHTGSSAECQVQFEDQQERWPLRLCAVRKSAAAVAAAQRQARNERTRKGGAARPETLQLAGWMCLVTSLPASVLSTHQVLELYRCRWQVELAFKRLKSLLELGHLPKKDPRSCRAWMQGKVLLALLTDKLILESELFSPWGYGLGG